MPSPARQPITVALIGNPNTGKSTLFTALCGVHQHVGNYPGVTVEKKEGDARIANRDFKFIDLPGTYSLAARSPDEMVTVDVLLGRRGDTPVPDVVLCVVDASNLERNLYLASQALELGRPLVLAVNMTDVADQKGLRIDLAALAQRLNVPVVALQAHRKQGLAELKAALVETSLAAERLATQSNGHAPRTSPLPAKFVSEVARLSTLARQRFPQGVPDFLLGRLLLDTSGFLEQGGLPGVDAALLHEVRQSRATLAQAGLPVPGVEAISRYEWIGKQLAGVVHRPAERPVTLSDRLDKLLTHRVWGVLVFSLLMLLVFELLFRFSTYPMDWIDGLFAALGDYVAGKLGEGPLGSLLSAGVIGGVGGVLVFLPQIVILFLFIAILEDCGYMARAAYLMDKVMSRVGLSGKSFIPLLSSFACAIPGIMATRVIESRRDRLLTILVAPLMSCSARLPVYGILIRAFIPNESMLGGWLSLHSAVYFGMYALGIVTAFCVAWVLRRTLLQGATPPFVMELPSYKLPSPRIVFGRVLDRAWAYIQRAGTLILAISILVWAAGYFPREAADASAPLRDEAARLDAELAALPTAATPASPATAGLREQQIRQRQREIANEISGRQLRHSFLGQAGQALEPLVRPLGWDWRIGCAVVASFPAREIVVGTLGVIYQLGEDVAEDDPSLAAALQRATWEGSDPPRKVFNIPVAMSIMVFFALCAQCASTLVVIRRETNSWRWPLFTFAYMTILAYVGAAVTYHLGMAVLTSFGGAA